MSFEENNQGYSPYPENNQQAYSNPNGAYMQGYPSDSHGANQGYQSDLQGVNQGYQSDLQGANHAYHPFSADTPVQQQHYDAPVQQQPYFGASHFQEPPEAERKKSRLGMKLMALLLVCTLGGGAIGGFLVSRYMNRRTLQTTNVASIEKVTSAPTSITPSSAVQVTGGTMSTPDIAEMASPATVAIFADVQASVFGQTMEVPGSGSGVLISEDGYVVTNNHVAGRGKNIRVVLADGSEYPAEIVGTNEITDVAVLKISADKALPFLKFGNSSELRVGETVIAIGNPLGELQGTVSQGIVSALHRNVTIEGQEMKDLIQMDAAINSGNSGGALLNTKGELIGINVAKTDGNNIEGIAFAIPADTAFNSVSDIMNGNSTLRPMMGIIASTVNPTMKSQYGVPDGVWVEQVSPGTPAEAAKLQPQDVIIAANGESVATITELNKIKDQQKVGDEFVLTVYRAGEEITVTLVLGSN